MVGNATGITTNDGKALGMTIGMTIGTATDISMNDIERGEFAIAALTICERCWSVRRATDKYP